MLNINNRIRNICSGFLFNAAGLTKVAAVIAVSGMAAALAAGPAHASVPGEGYERFTVGPWDPHDEHAEAEYAARQAAGGSSAEQVSLVEHASGSPGLAEPDYSGFAIGPGDPHDAGEVPAPAQPAGAGYPGFMIGPGDPADAGFHGQGAACAPEADYSGFTIGASDPREDQH